MDIKMKPGNTWPRIRQVYESGLWRDEPPAEGPLGRGAFRVLRAVIVALRASQDGLLNLHALGLVYSTLLSLVPFLAVAFSVLKAFGAHYRLEPLVARMLAPLGTQGAELADRVVEFVSHMSVGVLGAVGLAGLFYTALSLVGRIEDALNHIWNVRRSRALRRKFSDYLSVLLVGPVLVFAAFALIASLRSSSLVQRLLQLTRLETITVSVAGHVMPFVLLAAAFTFLYRYLPYTRVRLDAAAVGGITAAVLWQLAGVAFAALVAGSASYAAIYSSFAVLVVSLIWLHVAWLVVLIGGQVAYADQHPSSYAAARLPHGVLFRERIGLAALTEITRRYLAGQPPHRVDELARAIEAPQATLEELVDTFVARGILVRANEPESVVLSHPPEQFLVVDLLDVIRDPAAVDARTPGARVNAVSEVLHRRDEALRNALDGVTLRSLAGEAGETPSRRTVADLAQHRRREATG